MASKQWHQAVNRRLGAREVLDTERAYAEFWSPLGLFLEVMEHLARRRKATGIALSHEAPLTLGDYALAWNGARRGEVQAD